MRSRRSPRPLTLSSTATYLSLHPLTAAACLSRHPLLPFPLSGRACRHFFEEEEEFVEHGEEEAALLEYDDGYSDDDGASS